MFKTSHRFSIAMMDESDKNKPIVLAKGYRFQWEPAQDSHVLLYPEGMVKLNQTASLILSQVDGIRSTQQIVELLSKQYPDADVDTDTEAFIMTALENRWILLSTE